MWKTGHSLIKNKMKEVNAPLAGEMSGHIFLVIGTLVLMMQSMLQFGSSMLLIDREKIINHSICLAKCNQHTRVKIAL